MVMKHSEKNEMDLLLRNLAKRERDSIPLLADSNADADHLDVDELSSYAEDVLPTATRARYTAHIVDCAQCRGLIVQLASAAGTAIKPETTVVSPASTFWQKLASLFSPMVLKYAAPALILLVGIGIGVMRWRPDGETMVAFKEPAATQPQENYGLHDGTLANTPAAPVGSPPATDSGNARANESGAGTVRSAEQEQQKDLAAVADKPAPVSREEVSQPYATEPPATVAQAPPPPKAVSGDVKVDTAKEHKPQTVDREDQNAGVTASRDVGEKGGRKRDEDSFAVGKSEMREAPTVARARAPRRGQEGSAADEAKKAKNEKDGADDAPRSVSVAGREFRRQGDGWIDTAYQSWRAVTTVRRGSEQYRALIADEPEIRTIANALSGTVIVVWKGRAYRIQ
jgi:hypothetical protein